MSQTAMISAGLAPDAAFCAETAHTIVSRRDRLFYTGMSLASLVAVFIGFAPTYYLRTYYQTTSLTPLVHLHGIVFTSWFLLFATQTTLVARRRVDLHRRLGVAGGVLAGLMVIVGLTAAIAFARRNYVPGNNEALTFLTLPFGDIVVFIGLVGAGLCYRRRTETHKRLMLLATLSILDAAVARWPISILATSSWAFFAVTDLFVLAGPVYDVWSRKRVHPAYVWGPLFVIASQPLRMALANTSIWLDFATLLVR